MKRLPILAFALAACSVFAADSKDGWTPLFDGKSLDGWKANEHAQTFSVKDGEIVVKGDRGHLFYVGPVGDHDFKNFEFSAEVLTRPNSNSASISTRV